MRKRTLVTVATTAMVLAGAAVPALASEPVRGGGSQDLGLDSVTVTSATLSDPKTGQVVVSGVVACSEPLQVLLHSSVRQNAGRGPHLVEASGGAEVACDGQTPFSFAVSPDRGRLRAGDADVFAAALAEDERGFDFVEVGPAETTLTPSR